MYLAPFARRTITVASVTNGLINVEPNHDAKKLLTDARHRQSASRTND
jgi:hypothetical protein